MARYIDADKVTELIKNYGKGAISDGLKSLDPVDDIVYLMRGVDLVPAADVVEVKHGEWKSEGIGYAWCYVCSECGWKDGYPFDDRHRFCPYCGAKMDLDETNARDMPLAGR